MLGIKMAVAALFAILLGNGSVVLFNRIPVRWFEDEGELPEELKISDFTDDSRGGRQRLTSTPWKYIFVAMFGMFGVYLGITDSLQYQLAVLVTLFVVLEIAICDAKYMIVPDQFNVLLAVCGFGFIGYYDYWWEQLAGAGIGAALIISIYGLGRLIYGKASIGGADLKFFASMGLIGGREGVLVIFIITELLIALHSLAQLLTDRDTLKSRKPMLPYAMAATVIYFLFLNGAFSSLQL